MACATLKRPLEFDSIHNSPSGSSGCSPRPHKRRRCLPMSMPATNVNTSLTASSFAALPRASRSTSPFINAAPVFLQDDIAQYVRQEIKRLKRRRLLQAPSQSDTSTDSRSTMDISSPTCTTSPWLTSLNALAAVSMNNTDKPLFSFRQVVRLCSHLLRDHESCVREEYDCALLQRKEEQYDCFVKFTADQLRPRPTEEERPTYLS